MNQPGQLLHAKRKSSTGRAQIRANALVLTSQSPRQVMDSKANLPVIVADIDTSMDVAS